MPGKSNGKVAEQNGTSLSENHLTSEKNAVEVERSDPDDGRYLNLIPFCVFFGLSSLFSSSLTVYLSSQITTMEKVFEMSSERAGILMSANDIGFLVTVLFVSHFLHRFHMPRLLAGFAILFGTCGALSSLPHFIEKTSMPTHDRHTSINDPAQQTDDIYLCVASRGQNESFMGDNCGRSKSGQDADNTATNHWVLSLLFTLMLVQGIAKSPRTSLSSTYVDNNSPKLKTGFYLGILHSFSIFGPFLAITAGGLFNKLPIDLKDTSLTPEDPRWLGAWWLGFIIFGCAAVTSSVPLFFLKRGRKSAVDGEKPGAGPDPPLLEQLKDLPRSLLRILTQPVYVLLVASTITQLLGLMALGVFGPKYVENQFNVPTWKANTVLGAEKLVTTVLGTFLGGVVTRRLRLGVPGCLKLVTFSRALSVALSGLYYVFGCDNQHIHGMASQISGNLSCDCTGTPFLPVCVDGSATYYSPCHAGCRAEVGTSGYGNCTMGLTGDVTMGLCDTGCPYFIPYIASSAMSSLVATMALAPLYVVLLRSVKDSDRSLGVGLNSFLMSILVFLPAPIVYGQLFDGFCSIWRHKCGVQGACALYDIREMRVTMVSVEFGFRLASTVLSVAAVFLAKRKFGNFETENKTVSIEKTN